MILEGSELTKDDMESQLYDEFEHFRQFKGETIQDYYVRFEESNFDQLYAYLKQHEVHANENRTMMERFLQPTNDPLALVSNASVQHSSTDKTVIEKEQSLRFKTGRVVVQDDPWKNTMRNNQGKTISEKTMQGILGHIALRMVQAKATSRFRLLQGQDDINASPGEWLQYGCKNSRCFLQVTDDNDRKKAETSVPKPISALTVYPPNTPVKLVPRVLPTKSQVWILKKWTKTKAKQTKPSTGSERAREDESNGALGS
ncbi:hypothetical protein Tco_0168366 [Tanacetum coccineum]